MSSPFFRHWTRVMPYVSLLFVIIVSVLYINHTVNQSNGRWCSLLGTMTTAYREQPPTTPTGQKLARDMQKLHSDFHCK